MSSVRHDHQIDREHGGYWACERPESPPLEGVWWDERCAGCRLMYDAAIANGLGYAFVIFVDDGQIPIAEAPIRQWRELGYVGA